MNKVALLLIAWTLFDCSVGTASAPATMPTTRPSKKEQMPLCQVEVTLLGKITDVKGMKWPRDRDGRWLSRSIEEPCNLTVHLLGGKVLRMRTRPILIVSRISSTDIVGSIDAPPEGQRGSLREKATEVEKLLDRWQITPSEQMRAELNEWKLRDYAGTGIGGRLRAAMDLGERAWLSFRVDSGGPEKGGWNLIVEIEARAEEMQRVRHESEVRGGVVTQPSQTPSTKGSR